MTLGVHVTPHPHPPHPPQKRVKITRFSTSLHQKEEEEEEEEEGRRSSRRRRGTYVDVMAFTTPTAYQTLV